MRPVLHGDVVAAARAIYRLAPSERPRALHLMMARTEAADAYRRHFGHAHPAWGNGSLAALAFKLSLPPEPSLDDPDYCRCLAAVLDAVATWSAWRVRPSGRN